MINPYIEHSFYTGLIEIILYSKLYKIDRESMFILLGKQNILDSSLKRYEKTGIFKNEIKLISKAEFGVLFLVKEEEV